MKEKSDFIPFLKYYVQFWQAKYKNSVAYIVEKKLNIWIMKETSDFFPFLKYNVQFWQAKEKNSQKTS